MESSSSRVVRVGVFELDLRAGELRKNGSKLRLQEQPFQVLAALVEKPGEVVLREELKERLWADDTFVDFDHSLSTAINKIRQVLGDSATHPRFIETIPRRGYRFLADVPVAAERTLAHQAAGPIVAQARSTKRQLVAVALGVVAVAALGLWLWGARDGSPSRSMRVVRVTSDAGREIDPTFAPDGQRIAYSWNGPSEDDFDIYVKTVSSDQPRRLTENPADERAPSWSPDGRLIAFFRSETGASGSIYVIPESGGAERRIATVELPRLFGRMNAALSWTPDGQSILSSDRNDKGQFALVLINVQTGQKRAFTDPAPGERDVDGVISPAGDYAVVLRGSTNGRQLLRWRLTDGFILSGEPRRLEPPPTILAVDPEFSADGETLVFADRGSSGTLTLRRASTSGDGDAGEIAIAGHGNSKPATSRQGDRLAFAQSVWEVNIWEASLAAPGQLVEEPSRIVRSTGFNGHPAVSPDGVRIAFQSNRTGNGAIWVADRDGTNPARLTAERTFSGSPQWSPDGRQILFDSVVDDHFQVFAMNSDGGAVMQLTHGPGNSMGPQFSRDGLSFYYQSNRDGVSRVYRAPLAGGDEVCLTPNSRGGRPHVSLDGGTIYYTASGEVWSVSAEGGASNKVTGLGGSRSFAVARDGIYLISPENEVGAAVVRYYRFADGSTTDVLEFPGIVDHFAVTPDGRALLLPRMESFRSDIMMIESFR